jgi:TetR/AcrR family transcriptional regulator of autoinduction and epiphytic fitness
MDPIPKAVCPVARGRPRAASGEQRRQHLLDAAEAVFLTAGYHAATMDDLARAAGMSKRTVYQVVASKAALFEALLNDRFCPLTLPCDDDGRPLAQQLSALLQTMAALCLAPQRIAMLRLMIAEAPLSRDMADAMERLGLGRGNGALEQWMDAQVALGRLRPGPVQEARKALFFTAFGEALLLTLLRVGEPPDAMEIERRIAYAVRLFLRDAAS